MFRPTVAAITSRCYHITTGEASRRPFLYVIVLPEWLGRTLLYQKGKCNDVPIDIHVEQWRLADFTCCNEIASTGDGRNGRPKHVVHMINGCQSIMVYCTDSCSRH